MQECKAIPHRNTDFDAKLDSSSCIAANHRPNLSLQQVDDAVGDTARLGVKQDGLLAVQLADHKQFAPPMGLQAGKHCARGDQGIDSFKSPLQEAELATYCGFYLAASWFLLFGDIEEKSACSFAIIAGLVLATV